MTFRTEIVISDLLKDLDKIQIKCPKCSRGSPHTVGRVRHNPNLKCPTCWTSFLVDISQQDSEMSSAG